MKYRRIAAALLAAAMMVPANVSAIDLPFVPIGGGTSDTSDTGDKRPDPDPVIEKPDPEPDPEPYHDDSEDTLPLSDDRNETDPMPVVDPDPDVRPDPTPDPTPSPSSDTTPSGGGVYVPSGKDTGYDSSSSDSDSRDDSSDSSSSDDSSDKGNGKKKTTGGTAKSTAAYTGGWSVTYTATPTYTPDTVNKRDKSKRVEMKISARTNTKGDIILDWDKVPKAGKYTVYLYNGEKYDKLAETDKPTYTHKSTKGVKTYKFMVRYSISGSMSSVSDSFKITVTLRGSSKPVVKATAKDGKVTLKWDAVPDAKQYAVYRMKKGKIMKVTVTKKTAIKFAQRSDDTGYAVKAEVNGKWTTITKKDIVSV